MTYEYRYFKGMTDPSPLLQRMDEVLFECRQQRGEFYASTAEWMLMLRFFVQTLDEKHRDQIAKFSGKFVTTVVDERWGKDKIFELMEDCDAMTKYVVSGVKQA